MSLVSLKWPWEQSDETQLCPCLCQHEERYMLLSQLGPSSTLFALLYLPTELFFEGDPFFGWHLVPGEPYIHIISGFALLNRLLIVVLKATECKSLDHSYIPINDVTLKATESKPFILTLDNLLSGRFNDHKSSSRYQNLISFRLCIYHISFFVCICT